jgi:putative sterol carrier protein
MMVRWKNHSLSIEVKARRRWWLVSEGSAVDLCMTDPGYEVDLFIVTDVHTMTAVWAGDLRLGQAIASGRLEVQGPNRLKAKLGSWFGLSPFAGIKDQRASTNVTASIG